MAGKHICKMVLLLAFIAILSPGSFALAHMGEGSGYKHGGHHGSGWHHQDYGGFGDHLSEEQIKQMQAEHKAFFEATKEMRQQVYQKRLELRSELAKKEPDSEKSIRLQKEISELKAQMGLKRLNHILKLKKINPDVGRGFMGRGWGGCGMMGPGHHMNPGMMGHGYPMGPGMMGPGGFGRDDTRQFHRMQNSPAE